MTDDQVEELLTRWHARLKETEAERIDPRTDMVTRDFLNGAANALNTCMLDLYFTSHPDEYEDLLK